MKHIKITKTHASFLPGQSFPATNELASRLINAGVAVEIPTPARMIPPSEHTDLKTGKPLEDQKPESINITINESHPVETQDKPTQSKTSTHRKPGRKKK